DRRSRRLPVHAHRHALRRGERRSIQGAESARGEAAAVPRQPTRAAQAVSVRGTRDGQEPGCEGGRAMSAFKLPKIPHIKSVETRYLERRDALFRGLHGLDRRSFMKVSLGALGAAAAAGVAHHFHSFLPIRVLGIGDAQGAETQGFSFAYISDSHLYARGVNERFIRQLLRAVDDVNALD